MWISKNGLVYTNRLFALAVFFIGLGLCVDSFVLLHWLNTPLLDEHSFRQTQTALTSLWLLKGGPFFAYQTPVLGAPWAIPFEFPFYQGLVALVSLTGIPLDAAGRLVSFLFFILSVIPLKMLWNDLKLPLLGFPVTCALLLLSPEYVFYSRTFLMESCAWFFSLLWLAFFIRFLGNGRLVVFFAALLSGALAILVKATTPPAFLVLGGLAFLNFCFKTQQNKDINKNIVKITLAILLMGFPLAIGTAWTEFADALKAQNIIGQYLTAKHLEAWNFGTISQRLSFKLWVEVILGRVFTYTFGLAWIFVFIPLAAVRAFPRETKIVGALLLAFLVPFLVFTNLHIIHNYYQYANEAFLVCAVGISLGCLGDPNKKPVLSACILSIIIVSQIGSFCIFQLPWLRKNPANIPDYVVALAAKAKIPSGDSLLVIGDDWTSIVPYYSQRKSLAIPAFLPNDKTAKILQNPQAYLGRYPLGGVVVCTPTSLSKNNQQLLQNILSEGKVISSSKNCTLTELTSAPKA